MRYTNTNFFTALKRNGDRYLRQKQYFYTVILPKVMNLVAREVIDEFKINLADNILDEPIYFEIHNNGTVTYDNAEYHYLVEKTETGETTLNNTMERLIPVLSDKKFLYLQETISEFFEILNMKYIKGAERAYKSNVRLNEMFGIFEKPEITTDWMSEQDNARCICKTMF